MPARNRRNHFSVAPSAWRWGDHLCSSSSSPLDWGRCVLRIPIVCALFSICAGWALSGGNIARIADMRRNVALPLYSYSGGSWLKQPLEYWRERWPTPDGDFVDIDWLPAEEPGDDADVRAPKAPKATETTKATREDGQRMERNLDLDANPSQDSGVGADDLILPRPSEDDRPNDEAAITVTTATTATTAIMEGPRGATAWAERTLGSALGVGHPEAPETVHGNHSAWMAKRIAERTNESGQRRRLVVLLHGLEGSSTAPLTKRFSSVYARNGFDVAAVNFRGCGGELGKFPLGYHLGFTEDLLHVIEEIHRRFPGAWDRMYLSGFSLGGNVIIKFLGEQGDRARELGVYGASVACVPFEPQLGAQKLDKDLVGRYVYMPAFMAWLNVKAAEHAKAYPDVLNLEDLQDIKTFAQFDTSVTLPVFGFPSTEEYYRHVNAANYLSSVRVPLLVVNAKDDPFIDGDALPQQESVGDAPVRLIYHDYGGHCGFISGLLPSAWKDFEPGRREFTQGLADVFGRGRSWNVFPGGSDGETSLGKVPSAAAAARSSLSRLWGGGVSETGRGEIEEREDTSDGSDCNDGESKRAGGTKPMGSVREGKWLPTELVRFVTHLDGSLHKDGKPKRDRREGWDVAIEEL